MRIVECHFCNVDMKILMVKDVEIDKCPKCEGVWLDKGELEELAEKERDLTREAVRTGNVEPVTLLEILAGKY